MKRIPVCSVLREVCSVLNEHFSRKTIFPVCYIINILFEMKRLEGKKRKLSKLYRFGWSHLLIVIIQKGFVKHILFFILSTRMLGRSVAVILVVS